MAITILPPERPFDETEFKKRISDEYSILQDKMDKIGAFRVTIKGWCVTALIAATAASSASGSLLTGLSISIGLCTMNYFFFRFELEQVRLSRIYGSRALFLEQKFGSIDRSRVRLTRAPFPVPFTAHEIGQASRQRDIQRRELLVGHSRLERFQINLADQWPLLRKADFWFYTTLFLLALLLPMISRHSAVIWHFRHFRVFVHSLLATRPIPLLPFGIPRW